MNHPLTIYIQSKRLDPVQVMNQLQDAAMISDNCVNAEDVWEGDAERAVKWLELDNKSLI